MPCLLKRPRKTLCKHWKTNEWILNLSRADCGECACVCVSVRSHPKTCPPVFGCRNNYSSSIITAQISCDWKQNHLKTIVADWSHAGAASVSNSPWARHWTRAAPQPCHSVLIKTCRCTRRRLEGNWSYSINSSLWQRHQHRLMKLL